MPWRPGLHVGCTVCAVCHLLPCACRTGRLAVLRALLPAMWCSGECICTRRSAICCHALLYIRAASQDGRKSGYMATAWTLADGMRFLLEDTPERLPTHTWSFRPKDAKSRSVSLCLVSLKLDPRSGLSGSVKLDPGDPNDLWQEFGTCIRCEVTCPHLEG